MSAFFWSALALAEMGGIWFLSSRSMPLGACELPFPHADKVAHFLLFFLLSFLWSQALGKSAWPMAVAIAVFWGALDEGHQFFVPGRDADVLDFLADALGSFFLFFLKKKS
jgi:VanZ family protein